MLFEFILRPLEEVQPWGEDEPTLHWFGLTDGWCWWNVGLQQLFRNSQAWLDHWVGEYPEIATDPPYVDYQVVRPWEDLLTSLRSVLDPVPDDLIARTNDRQKWELFREQVGLWVQARNTDEAWNLWQAAFHWWSKRSWDAGYLRRPPKIWLWTQGDTFHIRWDNRDVIDDGLPVWEATEGEITIPTADLVAEAKLFDDRLMSAMAERVKAVVSGKLRPDIQIDLAHLAYEQSDRSTWMENALTFWMENALTFWMENALTLDRLEEDWDKVRGALATLEQMCYNNGVEGL